MFYDCISLTYLNLNNFDTSSVTQMISTFFNCFKLTSINLQNFNTSLVKDMESMFYGCNNIFKFI